MEGGSLPHTGEGIRGAGDNPRTCSLSGWHRGAARKERRDLGAGNAGGLAGRKGAACGPACLPRGAHREPRVPGACGGTPSSRGSLGETAGPPADGSGAPSCIPAGPESEGTRGERGAAVAS